MGNVANKEERSYILIIGLHEEGRSTILLHQFDEFRVDFKNDMISHLRPSILHIINIDGKQFNVIDRGGRQEFQTSRENTYRNVNSIIFVVDGSDQEKVAESKAELWGMLSYEKLKDTPVLVMVNNQYYPNAMSTAEVAERLDIHGIKDRIICVRGTYDGTESSKELQEGLSWIRKTLKLQKQKKEQLEHHTWLSKLKNYLF